MRLGHPRVAAAFTLLTIACFVAFKIPHLPIPYFWDEIGVYAPAALRLHDTHITLMPGGLAPELSRGHPMLAVALYAGWMRIFGTSIVAAHSLSLLLAVLALGAVWMLAHKLSGPWTAALAVIFTATQPVFFAMAGIVMPEMLLTLFTLVAAYGLLTQRLYLYIIFACLAILTKESALSILPAACVFIFWDGWKAGDLRSGSRWRKLALGASPVLMFALFLVVQKAQNGWYFFPLHVGYIKLSPSVVGAGLAHAFRDLFLEQGRWLIGLSAIVGGIAGSFRKFGTGTNARASVLAGCILLFAIVFAATNFYLTRYLLYVVPFVTVAGAQAIEAGVTALPRMQLKKIAATGAAVAALILGSAHIDAGHFEDTTDMSYRTVVRNMTDALRWAGTQPWHTERVGANFPIFQALSDPRNGYVRQPWPYTENCQEPTRYAILWHDQNGIPASLTPRSFQIVREFRDEFSRVSIVEFK